MRMPTSSKKEFQEVVIEDFTETRPVLISRNNDWIIIAGEHLVVWKDNQLYEPVQELLSMDSRASYT